MSHNPDTYLVRTVYAGASPVPSYEDRETAFNRWLEQVRAEAKAEALREAAEELGGFDIDGMDEPVTAHDAAQWLRARANQYKENQS
ncbi:hypothetical protein D3C74_284610 [compost metagenome]